jgi:hypothetical protein
MNRFSHRLQVGSVAVIATVIALTTLASVATAAPNTALTAAPAATCSPKAYSYAGLVSNAPAQGIQAVVTTQAAASVLAGHTAAWIGIGSPTAGPTGQAEWLQTGVNTQAGIGSQLYAEITLAGQTPQYLTLASNIIPGSSYRLAVVQLAGKPDVWHVLVNGKPATGPITLPGSSKFRPMAMGESWSGGTPHCNGFNYRFAQLQTMTAGSWKALTGNSVITDLGYKVIDKTNTGFTSVSG